MYSQFWVKVIDYLEGTDFPCLSFLYFKIKILNLFINLIDMEIEYGTTVFVVGEKYLKEGVNKYRYIRSAGNDHTVESMKYPYSQAYIYKQDLFLNYEDAVREAEKRRDAYVKKLEKRIQNLKQIDFNYGV